MGKNKELNSAQRGAIVYGYLCGHSYQKIANTARCGKTTVYDVLKRLETTGATTPPKRRGPKPAFDTPTRAALKEFVTQDAEHRRLCLRKITTVWNTRTGQHVSDHMVRQALKTIGLHSRIPRQKPLVSEINRQKRLEWALKHKGWTSREWRRVLWTDESTFTVFPQGSKSRVWRAAEDVFDASCLGATGVARDSSRVNS